MIYVSWYNVYMVEETYGLLKTRAVLINPYMSINLCFHLYALMQNI
jgi:hypothetical protein